MVLCIGLKRYFFYFYFYQALFLICFLWRSILNCSTLFQGLLEGTAPPVKYVVNDRTYNMGYYLADGIYPEWQIMMKTIPSPQNEKQIWFAKRQESRRKDVEWGFFWDTGLYFLFFLLFFFGLLLFISPYSHLCLTFTESVWHRCTTMQTAQLWLNGSHHYCLYYLAQHDYCRWMGWWNIGPEVFEGQG